MHPDNQYTPAFQEPGMNYGNSPVLFSVASLLLYRSCDKQTIPCEYVMLNHAVNAC